ncbi:TerD family protein [Streptomyces palmae]|nr:TerD family protein [Streptomyces palmae]
MNHIAKGANAFVPTVALRVAVRHELRPGAPLVAAGALLLTANGRVRGEADLVFHGRPVHPSGAVRHVVDAREVSAQWLELDLPRVEAAIERVLVVCSMDRGTVGDLAEPTVEAYAPEGTSVARYTVTDAAAETAFVFGEFYRRAGGWKFRAVGQGYASGPAGLATDFGLAVAAAATAPAPAVPPPAPASPGPVPLAGVSKTTGPSPVAPVRPAPAAVPMAALMAKSVSPAPVAPRGAWTFGAVFDPHTVTGKGSHVVTAARRIPPGPVLVEMEHEGGGLFCVDRLDKKNEADHMIFNSTLKDFRGNAAVDPGDGPRLRLRVEARGRWTLTFRPLADARRLESELTGRGPEALLYMGPVADLEMKLRGENGGGYCGMYGYEVAGHPTIAAARERTLVNAAGRNHKVSSPLPDGPLLLSFYAAEGSWRLKVRPV